ncbi:MAG: SufS family cysteine desulfurase [Candidatus Marinimicrobia bacterium]|nr:SufS family cysteine desulfurase [Candidatus Neomarinimicrobiota bacterium]
MLDVEKIRKDFPIFNDLNKPFIYLDSASTSQKPQKVIDTISSYYNSYTANVHRALYSIGEKATDEYENVRLLVKKMLNVPDSHSVIFTSGTTESINLIAYSWGLKNLKKADSVLITEMEHHSNIIPWQLITKKTNSSLNYIPLCNNGTLNTESMNEQLLSSTKIISISHQSNVFGTINPIKNIIDKAKSMDILTLIDGAQAVPHLEVDLAELDSDFYVFSGHKMLGPTGVGVLIGRNELLEEMEPFLGGGEMINKVNMHESTWNEIPWKFEAGTPKVAQVIGLGAAIKYLMNIGLENIHNHEQGLLQYALDILEQNENIILYGNPPERGAVIPFNLKNIHAHDLAKFLDLDGICIRAGHHCAQPIMDYLNVLSTARISMNIYNDENDIDILAAGIKKTISTLN